MCKTPWRKIQLENIPSLTELKQITLELVARGMTNADLMREEIRLRYKLVITEESGGDWNSSPSKKFINQHAHALRILVQRRIIRPIQAKEYELIV